MARVIVVLALMLAITAAMFAITRKSSVSPERVAGEPSATVRLSEVPDTAKVLETESVKSAEPRTFAKSVEAVTPAPEATASTQDVARGPIAGAAPSFATAGIDHKGNASFTGTATPGERISLLWEGKAMGSTTADKAGNWSLGFKVTKSDRDREILVSAQNKDGATVIGPQRALIRPPLIEGGLPRVALKATDHANATSPADAVPAPEAKTGLIVEKVAPGDDGLILLSGKADPGATVAVSINGEAAGKTQVASNGSWSLSTSNKSGKSADSFRLELVDKGGATLDRTYVPYKLAPAAPKTAANESKAKADFPSLLTSKPTPKPKSQRKVRETQDVAAMFEPKAAVDAGAADGRTIVKVRRGDSLWRIARRHLGKGKKWAAFYEANKDRIDDPDLIYPGQVLIIPG